MKILAWSAVVVAALVLATTLFTRVLVWLRRCPACNRIGTLRYSMDHIEGGYQQRSGWVKDRWCTKCTLSQSSTFWDDEEKPTEWS